jgi:hypothetical protein
MATALRLLKDIGDAAVLDISTDAKHFMLEKLTSVNSGAEVQQLFFEWLSFQFLSRRGFDTDISKGQIADAIDATVDIAEQDMEWCNEVFNKWRSSLLLALH